VTVSLDSGGLYAGSGADVSIVVKQMSGVIAVPTSAVTSFGAAHVVTVIQNGKAVRKVVTVGATDPTLTEITSGLAMGDRVVLAEMNLPLPTSNTSGATARALTGGGGRGGFGGGGGGARGG
jgi:multidrug efflux pump subunit AcrA (membrane-fusion protein)